MCDCISNAAARKKKDVARESGVVTTYRVVILGLRPGQNRDEALQRLAATFKQPVERLAALIARSRAVVKRGADIALAARLQAAIEVAGFVCVVEPEVGEAQDASAHVSKQATSSNRRETFHSMRATAAPVAAKSPTKVGPSKVVKYGGGFLVVVALLSLAGYLLLPRQQMAASAPSHTGPSDVEKIAASANAVPVKAPDPDAQFSPSERLALRLANTSWVCSTPSSFKMIFSLSAAQDGKKTLRDGLSSMFTLQAMNNGNEVHGFWTWKEQEAFVVIAQEMKLSNDEIGWADIDRKNWSVLRINISADGTHLSAVERETNETLECEYVQLKNLENTATQAKAVRAMMLDVKANGLGAEKPQPQTIVGIYQEMTDHQNACQAKRNTQCAVMCIQGKVMLETIVQNFFSTHNCRHRRSLRGW